MARTKPDWLKTPITCHTGYQTVSDTLAKHGLHTVCEEARCPNRGECWAAGTATFLILGDTCTRNCRFCAVKTAAVGAPPDPTEPGRLQSAIQKLGLAYAVITSVDRDDLPDKGAGHYAACIQAAKETGAKVEVLIPDYTGPELKAVVEAGPDVIAHNVETVERLQNIRDQRASYERSLSTLKQVKLLSRTIKTKSSIMLGLGETETEVLKAMDDLKNAGTDQLVLGQYLQPTKQQIQVAAYVHPDKFKDYAKAARIKGFKKVISTPLARTSYKAAEN
jgi:lipoyl synthase